jgi:glycosidase
VEVEEADSRSMLSLYKFLIKLRKQNPAVLFGKYEPVTSANENLFCYRRVLETQNFLVVLNFSEKPQTLTEHNIPATIVANTHLDRPEGESVNLMNFLLRGYEGYLFKI